MPYATINKPSNYFDTELYTGNGSTQTITGVDFKPDFLLIKSRSAAWDMEAVDVVRGSTKIISPKTTNAESTDAQGVTSFNSNGFSLGTRGGINASGDTYVGWSWLASNTTVSNNSGSITSTVSVNTTSGFSIVKWTGTSATGTIGHGLGVAPKVVIIKSLANAEGWYSYWQPLGNDKQVALNSTSAQGTTTLWNSTTPTSSVFSVINHSAVNGSGDYIAYCFADVKSFSKFGSYVGNSSTDGAFIYTGFKPAFVMIKASTNINGWWIVDNKRNTFNPENARLATNVSSIENATPTNMLDFLSNGFKLRDTDDAWNATGNTYIYMAFAEQPLVGTNNVPATAR